MRCIITIYQLHPPSHPLVLGPLCEDKVLLTYVQRKKIQMKVSQSFDLSESQCQLWYNDHDQDRDGGRTTVFLIFFFRYAKALVKGEMAIYFALIAHWLCYFNSAVNPLIYNFMSGEYASQDQSHGYSEYQFDLYWKAFTEECYVTFHLLPLPIPVVFGFFSLIFHFSINPHENISVSCVCIACIDWMWIFVPVLQLASCLCVSSSYNYLFKKHFLIQMLGHHFKFKILKKHLKKHNLHMILIILEIWHEFI